MEVIGSCSLCGGDVVTDGGAYAGTPPPAQCCSCGAVEARREGRVIPMVRHAAIFCKQRKTLDELVILRRQMLDEAISDNLRSYGVQIINRGSGAH